MTMNKIMNFNSEFGNIRVIEINNEPWFVGKDVAEILGYIDTADAIKKHVDEEDKQKVKAGEIPTLNISNYGAYAINESGLYSLILSSKLPNAKKFKHWVTSEVLPTIRKTGTYSMPQGNDLIALAVIEAKKMIEEKDKKITELTPKALFADAVSASNTSILIGEMAKLLKQNGVEIGQRRLFEKLRSGGR